MKVRRFITKKKFNLPALWDVAAQYLWCHLPSHSDNIEASGLSKEFEEFIRDVTECAEEGCRISYGFVSNREGQVNTVKELIIKYAKELWNLILMEKRQRGGFLDPDGGITSEKATAILIKKAHYNILEFKRIVVAEGWVG